MSRRSRLLISCRHHSWWMWMGTPTLPAISVLCQDEKTAKRSSLYHSLATWLMVTSSDLWLILAKCMFFFIRRTSLSILCASALFSRNKDEITCLMFPRWWGGSRAGDWPADRRGVSGRKPIGWSDQTAPAPAWWAAHLRKSIRFGWSNIKASLTTFQCACWIKECKLKLLFMFRCWRGWWSSVPP